MAERNPVDIICWVKAENSLKVWQAGDNTRRPLLTYFTPRIHHFSSVQSLLLKGVAVLPMDRPGACLPFPRAAAAGVWGLWPRLQICSEARKSVPLEPISPIRNALRPRHLPAAAVLGVAYFRGRGSARGERRLGASQHCRVGRLLHSLPRPRRGSGRTPHSTSGRAATEAPQPREGRGTSPRPDPWLQHQPQLRAQHERGRLSRGVCESISVSGRGARAAALPERSGSETGAAPALPLPGVTSPGAPLYLQLLREAAGKQAHLPAAAAEARGSTEEGPSGLPRRLSAGAGGTERRGTDRRFPELLLRSSVLTAVAPSQPATAILPLPRPPLSPPPPPTPSSSPRPAAPRRAARVPYVMASRPLGAAAGGPGTLSFACPRSPRARRDRSAWEPRDPERGHPARAWRGADSGPACLPGPQDFAPSRLGYGAGVSSKDGWGCL